MPPAPPRHEEEARLLVSPPRTSVLPAQQNSTNKHINDECDEEKPMITRGRGEKEEEKSEKERLYDEEIKDGNRENSGRVEEEANKTLRKMEEGSDMERKEEKYVKEEAPGPPKRKRDLIAYWLLGFCNNFTYWVMITAAYDLLSPAPKVTPRSVTEHNVSSGVPGGREVIGDPWSNTSNPSVVNTFQCHSHSTGAILLADTLPATAITLVAPLTLLVPADARVALLAALCMASYLILGLAHHTYVFLGVALASASRGFSDTTFLGHASFYHGHVLSVWSSGTGVATFVGPLLYSTLTTAGLAPAHALLTFAAVPAIIATSFWVVLTRRPPSRPPVTPPPARHPEEDDLVKPKLRAVIMHKLDLLSRSWKYLAPLSFFYGVMYFTNQGLLELVYFPDSPLSHAQQYSWSNTVRCLGTLVSRSAHTFLLIRNGWLYNVLAVSILAVIGTEAHYHYLPSEFIVFALLLLQGLLEGAAFRTIVFRIHNKMTATEREFSLSVFPVALFLPAVIAGLAALPVHDHLCQNNAFS